MSVVAAIGIGGTNFHYAAGTGEGELRTEIRTERTDPDALVDQITDAVAELQATVGEPLAAVCIASKGLVDHEEGVLTQMNIQGGRTLYGIDLQGPIRERFDLPLYLENDCTAAALAEYYYGAGQSYDSLAHVTVGTGIGAGIIDNETLLRGEANFAGEVGAIQVGPDDGLECFGIPGAWEAYCSGPGIEAFVRQQLATESRTTRLDRLEDLCPQTIFEVAKDGDAVAEDYLDTVARYNAVGFGTVANMYNPGIITLGGGVMLNNYDYLIDGIETYIDTYLLVDEPAFAVTEMGDDIGIYSALAQVRHLEVSRKKQRVS